MTHAIKSTTTRGKVGSKRAGQKYWSAAIGERSDALDLTSRIFTWRDPRRIAISLKRSALRSRRRHAGAYRSAMSMLNFYVNRAGRNLPADRRRVLSEAKNELRHIFGRA